MVKDNIIMEVGKSNFSECNNHSLKNTNNENTKSFLVSKKAFAKTVGFGHSLEFQASKINDSCEIEDDFLAQLEKQIEGVREDEDPDALNAVRFEVTSTKVSKVRRFNTKAVCKKIPSLIPIREESQVETFFSKEQENKVDSAKAAQDERDQTKLRMTKELS